ncbi:hypothetical protein F442_02735 [Phytophthora nicotianae P10297]|uniref:Uncharacterized protein n=1 Tax=Phytophthora nicotianae P10297 TaxID=1317064 RepID=W2ZXY1_PHYNI|nr:hypothetical protein F442_02735 [Phytophthora nicotianae P10297]
MDRLQYFVKHVGFLVSYSTKTSFRKWRFLTTSSKMRALTAITKRLVPIRSAQVCIAFGDWSCQDGLCGNPSAPVQALKKELERSAIDKGERPIDREDLDCLGDVLCCKNSRCKAHFWNRDVNAARNILELLKCRLSGLGRLAAFER